MIENLKKILISFGVGLGIGAVSGKIYYEKKYQMKLKGATFKSDEKLKTENVKENSEISEEKDPKESSEINKNKDDLSSLVKKVKDENPRVDYSTPTPNEKKHENEPEPLIDEDFEIEPEDFGELGDEDYEVVRILYLADGNMVYENGNTFEPVEEPQRKIGNKAMDILKKGPSDDVLYVRNKRIKIDYEIIFDDSTLNEVMSEEDDDDYEELEEE